MKLFTKSIFYKAIFLSFMFTLTACGGSSSDETTDTTDTSGTGTTDTTNTTDATDRLDIKDAIFTNTSADCADYDNSYEADVADVQEATDFVLDVVISSTDSDCMISSNNIPNHDFNTTGNFATVAREVSQEFIIERSPMLADSTTALSQQQYDVIMLNGVPLDILSAGCYENGEDVPFGCTTDDDWLLDPLGTDGAFGADEHNAHTQPTGVYHYHGSPQAMFDPEDDSAASPVIGFAADGFPVYGLYFTDTDGSIRKATSSYALKSGSRGTTSNSNPGGNYDGQYVDDYEYVADSGDLDECNGMTVNGQYGYYVTESYPWVIACFSGTPANSFSK